MGGNGSQRGQRMRPRRPRRSPGASCRSRLILGTGGFTRLETLAEAIRVSGTAMVTVALRRIEAGARGSLVDVSTAAASTCCRTPPAASRRATRSAPPTWRARRSTPMGEGRGDRRRAHAAARRRRAARGCERLVADGFVVLPYTTDDPVLARRLEDVGCAAVMPLGSPIGSGMGIRNPYNLTLIVEQAGVPVVLDAGVGTASDAALAMEIGCDAVLCASAISRAARPGRDGPRDPRRRRGRARRAARRADPAAPSRRGLDDLRGPSGARRHAMSEQATPRRGRSPTSCSTSSRPHG